MKTILLLFAFTSVNSYIHDDGHTEKLDCDGSLQLGDVNLITTTEIVTDETHKTRGLQVLGCGYWMVYEKKDYRGGEACIEASHGKMNLSDIGLRRVRSVHSRKTRCPRVAKRSAERTGAGVGVGGDLNLHLPMIEAGNQILGNGGQPIRTAMPNN